MSYFIQKESAMQDVQEFPVSRRAEWLRLGFR